MLHFNKGSEGVFAEGLPYDSADPDPYIARDTAVRFGAGRRIIDAIDKVAGAFQDSENVVKRYRIGGTVEEITSLSAPLGLHDTAFVQCGEYMLKVLFGDFLPLCNIG
jgi:hypothetical protein